MKQFTPKKLTQAVTVAMFTLMVNSVMANPNTANPATSTAPSYKTIGDLEIYTKPEQGGASVFMMLDMSGSMNFIDIPKEMQSKVQSQGGGSGQPPECRYKNRGGWTRWLPQEKVSIRIPKTDSTGAPLARAVLNTSGSDPEGWSVVSGPDYFEFEATGCRKPKENASGFEGFRLSDDGKSIVGYPSRVTNLKLGLGSLLANGQNLSAGNKMGLGYYENLSRNDDGINRQGSLIKLPVRPLTDDHRIRMLRVLKDIQPDGRIMKKYQSRPGVWPNLIGREIIFVRPYTRPRSGTNNLGLNSNAFQNQQWQQLSPNNIRSRWDFYCKIHHQLNYNGIYKTAYNIAQRTPSGPDGRWCGRDIIRPNIAYDAYVPKLGISTPMTNAFAESGAYMMGTTTVHNPPAGVNAFDPSGFQDSSDSTKTGNRYNSPIDRDSQCDGYGIYFLTDGAPNNHNERTQIMMAKTLNKSDLSVAGIEYDSNTNPDGMRVVQPVSESSGKWTGSWSVTGDDGPSWLYMGAYAKALRDRNNPSGTEIRTATVGFGPEFEALKVTKEYKGKQILDCSALDEMIAGASNDVRPSGTPEQLQARLAQLRQEKRRLERAWHTLGFRPTGSTIAPIGRPIANAFAYTLKTKLTRVTNEINRIERHLASLNNQGSGNVDDASTTPEVPFPKNKLIHTKNLCLLGSPDADYGKGGFTATSDPEVLLQSVKNFVNELNVVVPAAPSGTISVPKDPLSITNILPYAYLPMVQAEPASTLATWKGNLKKYHTLNGTLYGQNSTKLYKTDNKATTENRNFPFATNWAAKDLWQQTAVNGAAKPAIDVGGTYEHIKAPVAGNINNTRKVYLQSVPILPSGQAGAPTLVEVGVRDNRLFGFEQLDDSYTPRHIAYILNFLGFAVPTDGEITSTRAEIIAVYNDILTEVSGEIDSNKVLGGVVHSVPVLATYEGEFEDGNITNDPAKRKDYLLYGSMDGALHMVNADSGEESFNFIPKAMFSEGQIEALVYDSEKGRQGNPAFGVDAPWNVSAGYGDDNALVSGRITANKMYAYGGLRMGGVGFYGLNISDKQRPTMLFAINNHTSGFSRLGQTWSRPLTATIKLSHNQTKDVVIFGGGYDMCYENPLFKLNDNTNLDADCRKDKAQGNAVYMIDSQTGALLKSWTATEVNDGSEYMKHSIVGEIAGVDRNNNGYIDHLYFGDLGGQIFRIDLQEGSGTTASTITTKVTKIFDANAGVDTPNHIPYRFYDQPAVSVYKNEQVGAANSRFALINIASGDRSNPLSKRRTLDDANRIYGIFDDDVASADLFGSNYQAKSRAITTSNLMKHNPEDLENAKIGNNKAKVVGYQNELKNRTKKGWYYDLNRFNAVIGVPYLKSVGAGVADGGVYYSSVYSPEYNYKQGASCEATIAGGTERQLYCLPWGICAKPDGTIIGQSKNGTLGFIKGGPGIQELTIGTLTSRAGTPSRFRTLIGHEPINGTSTNGLGVNPIGTGGGLAGSDGGSGLKTGTGTGASKEGERVITAERFVVDIKRWYDLQISENN